MDIIFRLDVKAKRQFPPNKSVPSIYLFIFLTWKKKIKLTHFFLLLYIVLLFEYFDSRVLKRAINGGAAPRLSNRQSCHNSHRLVP